LAVITDWSEYRNPDFDRIKTALRAPNIVDGRNLYKPDRMAAGGFTYVPLGRCSGGICGGVK
jgi:UDPglucose 6-dehydrogenase